MSDSTETRCTWLGAAGFIIESAGTTLLSDPFVSRPPGVPPFPVSTEALHGADAILNTHGHFDHAQDLEPVARWSPDASIWAPEEVCRNLQNAGIDAGRFRIHEDIPKGQVGRIGIEVLRSEHIKYNAPLVAKTLAAVFRGPAGTFRNLLGLGIFWPMGCNSDFLLHFDGSGLTGFLSGSLGQSLENLGRHRPDVALLPYNGRSDMPKVSFRALSALRPRAVVFHHWDDFYPNFAPPQDPSRVVPQLRQEFPDMGIHIAQLGEPFVLEQLVA